MAVSDIFLGNDLVEVSRILLSIDKIGQRFIDRIYTKHEQEYCNSKSKPEIHYAGRFAAKEAIIKALKSSGFKQPTPFCSIEIESGVDGKPIEIPRYRCSAMQIPIRLRSGINRRP